MAGGRLQRLSVMHQCLDCIGILCSGKLLAVCLSSRHNRNRQIFLHKALIYFPHHFRTLFCFLICGMDGVPLLPQEFSGTQKRSCGLLPAKNGAPLVPYFRQIAVGLHRFAPHIAEQRLRCGADTEALLQRLHTAVGHPCNLRRKTFNMILLFLKQTLRDQYRKIYIFHSCIFKSFVQIRLNILPQSISVRQIIQTSFHS